MSKAEIISIGDEILIGQTVNTNAGWLGEHLSLIGVGVQEVSVIPDEKEHILRSLTQAMGRVDLVLITGGLGPTRDDITKETLAEYFDCELVLDQDVLAGIRSYFERKGREMLEANIRQAELPDRARIVRNEYGTASGMWFEKDGKVVISMPGVPYEMQAMMERELLPLIQERFGSEDIYHRTILTHGLGESFLANKIRKWEEELRKKGLKLAYLPSPGMVRLRISAIDLKDGRRLVEKQVEQLHSIIPEHIFGYEKDSIEELIGKLLRNAGRTLGTAESCTGGYVAHMITSVDGSSDYFKGSIVSYANEIKTNVLGVRPNDLEDAGAVSKIVVEQMAEGGMKALNVDYCIATSGIAGPKGGTPEKPVGTAWIAIAWPEGISSKLYNFGDNRERNIKRTALSSLNMLRDVLNG